jgi:hypothetical protein
VTVWCGLWAGGVIGPYFFNDTVNGDRYREMITNFFLPKLGSMDVADMWFQQDGAPCHTAAETINLLRAKFPGRVISRNGDIRWPARSCDLTPLDFFLWGFLKSKVYSTHPTTIEELKNNIISEINEIRPDLLKKIIENWVSRIRMLKDSNGQHLKDIIFHT